MTTAFAFSFLSEHFLHEYRNINEVLKFDRKRSEGYSLLVNAIAQGMGYPSTAIGSMA
jgi:hypothetical protein